MQLHTYLRKSLFSKAALATAALGGFFFFAGAPGAQAADRHDGDRHVTRFEYRRGIEDRGYFNRQANGWREERREYGDRDRDHRYRYDRDDDRYRDRDNRGFDRD